MSPLQRLEEIKQNWRSHTENRLHQYAATMRQVEALRVEVSALEVEIRRTECSSLPPAYKDARIRGLASRSAESYGRMLSLLREAADNYPSIVAQPLDIPHTYSQREREQIIQLPERPPRVGRRDLNLVLMVSVGFVLLVMLLSELYPVLLRLPVAH
jgi:hypothetical protein